jgi:hypothetical protein
MMGAVAFVGAILLWLGFRLIRRARGGFTAIADLLRMRARAVRALEAGLVEVEGTIEAVEAPITGLSKVRCVAVVTTLRSARRTIRGRIPLGEKRRVEAARATLRDASGACELDLEHAEVLGQVWTAADVPIASFREAAPAWASELCAEGATHVTVEERIIPEGARVLVAGLATELSLAEEAGDRGSRPRFRVEGSPSHALLLGFGGRTRLLLRAIAPAAFGVILGAYLCAFGIVALAVSVSG